MDDSVNVKYENSGTTTIQISGTPVNKRRQMFESDEKRTHEQTRNGLVQQNESAKVLISSIPTALPDANTADSANDYSSYEKNTASRKKVTFTGAVVINDDENTHISPSDESEAVNENGVVIDDVHIVHIDSSKHTAVNANDNHPLKNQKLKLKEPEVIANGAAVVPIVDEYEVHQLSSKLSSKEELHKLSGQVIEEEVKCPTKEELNTSIESSVSQDSNKQTKTAETKDSGRADRGRCILLWIAVIVIGIAIVGIIALAVLYARQFQLEDDAVSKLKSRLDLRPPTNRDLFVNALLSSKDESVVYYLAEDRDYIPWQKPNRTAIISWHRGTALNIYSIKNGEWKQRELGDTYTDKKFSYSLEVWPDTWYAANLHDRTDSYVLISTSSPEGNLGWIQSTNLAAQYPELENKIKPFNRV